MKQLLTTIMMLALFSMASCGKGNDAATITENGNNNGTITESTRSKMKITVGSAVFTATLYNNPAAVEFKKMLPLTLNMEDLNANEKFFYFKNTLPTSAAVGGDILAGDLMLYGNNCLVLFYKGFNTSYSYTKLGRIDNVSGLTTALGSPTVTVKFELE
jgi:hypothetical protein